MFFFGNASVIIRENRSHFDDARKNLDRRVRVCPKLDAPDVLGQPLMMFCFAVPCVIFGILLL